MASIAIQWIPPQQGFNGFQKYFFWTKVASALERLNENVHKNFNYYSSTDTSWMLAYP